MAASGRSSRPPSRSMKVCSLPLFTPKRPDRYREEFRAHDLGVVDAGQGNRGRAGYPHDPWVRVSALRALRRLCKLRSSTAKAANSTAMSMTTQRGRRSERDNRARTGEGENSCTANHSRPVAPTIPSTLDSPGLSVFAPETRLYRFQQSGRQKQGLGHVAQALTVLADQLPTITV